MKRQEIASIQDLDALESRIEASAAHAVGELRRVLNAATPMDLFALVKFTELGRDPLDTTRPLNLIEQLNQSFTYLASITAARWLFGQQPDCAPFVLNLGTTPGYDIESKCGRVVAETFAVTHPDSNDKLRKDVNKLSACSAEARYVFFLSPTKHRERDYGGVRVVHLTHRLMQSLAGAHDA